MNKIIYLAALLVSMTIYAGEPEEIIVELANDNYLKADARIVNDKMVILSNPTFNQFVVKVEQNSFYHIGSIALKEKSHLCEDFGFKRGFVDIEKGLINVDEFYAKQDKYSGWDIPLLDWSSIIFDSGRGLRFVLPRIIRSITCELKE